MLYLKMYKILAVLEEYYLHTSAPNDGVQAMQPDLYDLTEEVIQEEAEPAQGDQPQGIMTEDFFKVCFLLKGKLVMNDLLLLTSYFFSQASVCDQFLATVDYLDPILTYEDKLFALNILLYAVMSLKKFSKATNRDQRLSSVLNEQLLRVVEEKFHPECSDIRQMEILKAYFSFITNNHYIGEWFEELNNKVYFNENCFNLQYFEEERGEAPQSSGLGVIHIIKAMVNKYNSGNFS